MNRRGMESSGRPNVSEGNVSDFSEHRNAVYFYEPSEPNRCIRYEAINLPRQNGVEFCSEMQHVNPGGAFSSPLFETIMPHLPQSGMSQQENLSPPGMDQRMEGQDPRPETQHFLNDQLTPGSPQQMIHHDAHTRPNCSRESGHFPVQNFHNLPPSSLTTSTIDRGQVHFRNGIESTSQQKVSHLPSIATFHQPVHNPYAPLPEDQEATAKFFESESSHVPRQNSLSDSLSSIHLPVTGPKTPNEEVSEHLEPENLKSWNRKRLEDMITSLVLSIQVPLLLYILGCDGSPHSSNADDEESDFWADLKANYKKETLVAMTDEEFSQLVVYFPNTKAWIETRAQKPTRRNGAPTKHSFELQRIYEEIKNKKSLSPVRDNNLLRDYAELIMERANAFKESARGKKKTFDKNRTCGEKDKDFKILGDEISETSSLLNAEVSSLLTRLNNLGQGMNDILYKIVQVVTDINKNWLGVRNVKDEIKRKEAGNANDLFKRRQKAYIKEVKNESRALDLRNLINICRELCSRESALLNEPADIPAPSLPPTVSDSELDNVWASCMKLPEAERLILFRRLKDIVDPEDNVPEVVKASADERPQIEFKPPQFIAEPYLGPSCSKDDRPQDFPISLNSYPTKFSTVEESDGAPISRKRNAEMDGRSITEEKRAKGNVETVSLLPTHQQLPQHGLSSNCPPSQQHVTTSQRIVDPCSYSPPGTRTIPPYNKESPGVAGQGGSVSDSRTQLQTRDSVCHNSYEPPTPTYFSIFFDSRNQAIQAPTVSHLESVPQSSSSLDYFTSFYPEESKIWEQEEVPMAKKNMSVSGSTSTVSDTSNSEPENVLFCLSKRNRRPDIQPTNSSKVPAQGQTTTTASAQTTPTSPPPAIPATLQIPNLGLPCELDGCPSNFLEPREEE